MAKNLKLLLYGGVGLAAGTTLALVFPGAEGIAGTALMLVLSLSAALCGAAVPGIIHFESKSIRATGATVFFVVPWLVPPASLDSGTEQAPPTETEQPADPSSGGTTGTARPRIRIPPPRQEPTPIVRRPRTLIDELFAPKRG
jgi:hypothetical protein